MHVGAVEAADDLRQALAALGEGPAGEVVVAEREQVERDEVRGRLDGQLAHPRGGGVHALQQRLEVEPRALGVDDDDLAVDRRSAAAAPR